MSTRFPLVSFRSIHTWMDWSWRVRKVRRCLFFHLPPPLPRLPPPPSTVDVDRRGSSEVPQEEPTERRQILGTTLRNPRSQPGRKGTPGRKDASGHVEAKRNLTGCEPNTKAKEERNAPRMPLRSISVSGSEIGNYAFGNGTHEEP